MARARMSIQVAAGAMLIAGILVPGVARASAQCPLDESLSSLCEDMTVSTAHVIASSGGSVTTARAPIFSAAPPITDPTQGESALQGDLMFLCALFGGGEACSGP
jgi:hypothetical protein